MMSNVKDREFTVDWTNFYVKDWNRWLGEYVGKDNINALEIGCYEGRSSCWFCENILIGKNCKLVCIDSWAGKVFEDRFDKNTVGLNIRKFKKYSYLVLAELLANENTYYNFIYVDGNHSGNLVLLDMCLAWRILAKGGIMICDDYVWTNKNVIVPPKIAIDSWFKCNINEYTGYELTVRQCAIWKK